MKAGVIGETSDCTVLSSSLQNKEVSVIKLVLNFLFFFLLDQSACYNIDVGKKCCIESLVDSIQVLSVRDFVGFFSNSLHGGLFRS